MADRQPERHLSADALLVPVSESVTLRKTVAHAVEAALDDGAVELHFVAPVAWHDVGDVDDATREAIEDLLDRVSAWVDEDLPDGAELSVLTGSIGSEEYLFSPADYAAVLARYAADNGIGRVVLDPEYSPGGNVPLMRPMSAELRRFDLDVLEAPVTRPTQRSRLDRAGGLVQFGLLFGVSFLFYQLLGGFAILTGDRFDLYYELVTGSVAAGIVAGSLYAVALSDRARPGRLAGQLARLAVYVPYLLYEIVKSNVLITFIILHPKLPIDPRLTRVRSAVWGGAAIMTLANSITLTPGTLAVRSEGQRLYVHGLFGGAREGIAGGALERAVRFVFYGRRAMSIPTPEERGDYVELQGPNAVDDADAPVTDADERWSR